VKRRSRDINVFSLSAIDLFACALGAFILLSLISLQYYLKTQKIPEPVKIDQSAKPEDQIKQMQQALAAAQMQIQQMKEAAAEAQAQADAMSTESSRNRQLAFLGIVSDAKTFVILVDMSGSMKDYDHLVRKTLAEIVDQMDGAYQCQIIGFQGHLQDRMQPTLTTWQPAGRLAMMDDPNRAAALKFGDSLTGQFASGTPTYLALSTALGYPAEAIFLLTDGEPTDIENGWEIVSRITQENSGRKKIYSIAVGNYRKLPELVAFLDELSSQNGGKFLGVSD
jgi:hypothetical protein